MTAFKTAIYNALCDNKDIFQPLEYITQFSIIFT